MHKLKETKNILRNCNLDSPQNNQRVKHDFDELHKSATLDDNRALFKLSTINEGDNFNLGGNIGHDVPMTERILDDSRLEGYA